MPQNCPTRNRETKILVSDYRHWLRVSHGGCYVPFPLYIVEDVPMTEVFFT